MRRKERNLPTGCWKKSEYKEVTPIKKVKVVEQISRNFLEGFFFIFFEAYERAMVRNWKRFYFTTGKLKTFKNSKVVSGAFVSLSKKDRKFTK